MIEDNDGDSNVDPFEKLGQMGDDAERRAREAQEAEAQKKKRKRRESKTQGSEAQDVAGEKKSKKKRKASWYLVVSLSCPGVLCGCMIVRLLLICVIKTNERLVHQGRTRSRGAGRRANATRLWPCLDVRVQHRVT